MSRELERTGVVVFLSLARALGILNALGAAPVPAFVLDPGMIIGETVLDNWSGGLLAGDEDVDDGISGGKALGAPRGDGSRDDVDGNGMASIAAGSATNSSADAFGCSKTALGLGI